MYNIHTEMPSGSVSRGYDRKTEEEASVVWKQVLSQLRAWKEFKADVVMTDGGIEVRREHISNE
jgi:hypothetical protein